MKKSLRTVIFILLLVFAAFVVATEIFGMIFSHDETVNDFICDTVSRALSAICVALYIKAISFGTLSFRKITAKSLLVLPCFLVAVNNFPFYDWFSVQPEITRGGYLWLFVAECLAVGLFEEFLFRGLIFPLFLEKWNGSKMEIFKAVMVSSAVFAIFHIINVFSEPFGAVIMQVGYTFLFGMLCCFVMMYSESVWACVILHSAFNFAGLFASTMTGGLSTSVTTWIIMAVIAVIVAVYSAFIFMKVDEDFSKKFTLRKR